jgi:hypothetical protein
MITEFIHNHSILLLKVCLLFALIELVINVALIRYILKSRPQLSDEELAQRKKLKEAKNLTIDMNGLLESIHNSKALYKQLSTKCHPDRFIVPEMKEKANTIIQEVTQNKNNHAVLLQLKSKAEQELNIQFN